MKFPSICVYNYHINNKKHFIMTTNDTSKEVKNEDMVTRYHVYCPNSDANFRTVSTLGEKYFLYIPFWKLFVMMGMDWSSASVTRYGISTLVCAPSTKETILFLDKLGIMYKLNRGSYTLSIRISVAKKNLCRIDELYKVFETQTRHVANILGLREKENYFVNDEMITIKEWALERKRIIQLFNIENYG